SDEGVCVSLSRSLSENPSWSGEKGPAARRRPKAAGEAYFLYVEPAVEGANEADGPLSSLQRYFRRRLAMYFSHGIQPSKLPPSTSMARPHRGSAASEQRNTATRP